MSYNSRRVVIKNDNNSGWKPVTGRDIGILSLSECYDSAALSTIYKDNLDFLERGITKNYVIPKKPAMVAFKNSIDKTVGELHENEQGELVFEGDVSESAKRFFEAIVQMNNKWIFATKQGLQQIRDNSEDPEAKRIATNLLSSDY